MADGAPKSAYEQENHAASTGSPKKFASRGEAESEPELPAQQARAL